MLSSIITVVPNAHFRKFGGAIGNPNFKTWFQQPIQKKIRRAKRQEKAAKIAPRPASGNLKPLVHCPTQKYNSKVRLGRGFTLEELKAAGIQRDYAKTIGISVDHRRSNKSEESLNLNVARLKEYISRLVVFPKKAGKATAIQKSIEQLKGEIVAAPAAESFLSYAKVTEELQAANAYSTQRKDRNEARLKGIRIKKANSKKDEKAPKEKSDE